MTPSFSPTYAKAAARQADTLQHFDDEEKQVDKRSTHNVAGKLG
jgi:hypothetical protein